MQAARVASTKERTMTELSIYNLNAVQRLATEIASCRDRRPPVYMCIGTDKVFSDSLGPRVGSLLNEQMATPDFVYGMVEANITAENLAACHDLIRRLHPDSQIIVIDAAVGTEDQIGSVQISDGGITPGVATNKNLPQVGDLGIVGIVAERGMADFYTPSSSKEKLVNRVATFIADAIVAAQKQTAGEMA